MARLRNEKCVAEKEEGVEPVKKKKKRGRARNAVSQNRDEEEELLENRDDDVSDEVGGKRKKVEEVVNVNVNVKLRRKVVEKGKKTQNQNQEKNVEKINKHDPKWIEEVSLMCHQCQRNDKGRVVRCKRCKKKRYCIPCLRNWYPNTDEDYIAEACPLCRGNCNCKACLRLDVPVRNLKNLDLDISEDEIFEHYKYVLQILLPFLQQLNEEQMVEKQLEAKRQVIYVELLFLIFTEAVIDVLLISALPVAGRFVTDI
ncbi:hypothetical protein SO802_010449 [Lithocarpus litseifolius]|uniref:RING-type domain-containing protein n=1 Tax=Lithocarpus litseifolius TaxID=425828 RepID=A0AAW2DE94_9ROSI